MVANGYQLLSKCQIVAEGVVSGRLAFDMGDTSDDHDSCSQHHMKPIMEAFAVVTTATEVLLRSREKAPKAALWLTDQVRKGRESRQNCQYNILAMLLASPTSISLSIPYLILGQSHEALSRRKNGSTMYCAQVLTQVFLRQDAPPSKSVRKRVTKI